LTELYPSLKSIPSLSFPPTTQDSKAPHGEFEEGKEDEIHFEYSERTPSEEWPRYSSKKKIKGNQSK
jgi:hypothetical protein